MEYSNAPVLSFEKAVKRFDPKKLDASEIQGLILLAKVSKE